LIINTTDLNDNTGAGAPQRAEPNFFLHPLNPLATPMLEAHHVKQICCSVNDTLTAALIHDPHIIHSHHHHHHRRRRRQDFGPQAISIHYCEFDYSCEYMLLLNNLSCACAVAMR